MARELREFLRLLEERYPDQMVRVPREVDPAAFEVTAILQHLENRDRYPLVLFERPRNLLGEVARFPLISNVYATRERCALALGLRPEQAMLELSLEYARREERSIPPVVVSRAEAPAKEWVQVGEAADLRVLPIVRHHEMDPAPYIDMAVAMRDPDSGAYNLAFLRTMYQGPRRLGLHMSPRHNWQIVRKHERRGEPTPCVIVVSHHPAFYLGALNVSPFGRDDYGVAGSLLDEPLRLVPSETWGEQFLVPADAELLIEGEVLPGVREVEGPFGEFTGYYGPQRVRWVIEVKAITGRHDAIYQDVFVGHRDVWTLGSFPKEGSLYNRIKGVVPGVRGVYLPISGTGRFHCYISIDKRVDGESKQAALIALGECDFIKHVVVVDADIDPYKEEQVLWAIATRVQADRDVDIIRHCKGNTLDPSQEDDIMGAKMIIDATKPVGRPFEERVRVPAEALARIDLDAYLAPVAAPAASA
ncbi:MAG TPA: UbiD family decarboxylase [Chloroflexota bacterium]|nr:UbiD family decarboxylase [Chloroflexota bacterium]